MVEEQQTGERSVALKDVRTADLVRELEKRGGLAGEDFLMQAQPIDALVAALRKRCRSWVLAYELDIVDEGGVAGRVRYGGSLMAARSLSEALHSSVSKDFQASVLGVGAERESDSED